MILLSCQRWPPAAIAELRGCDATVHRWTHRYNQLGVTGLAIDFALGDHGWAAPESGQRIGRLLAEPKVWTIPRCYQWLGRPARR